jgi:hypothetical protein
MQGVICQSKYRFSAVVTCAIILYADMVIAGTENNRPVQFASFDK